MTPALSLYVGRTTHARRAPFAHRFAYRIAQILIDVDRLDDAARASRWFSVERFNLFSFRRRDHGDRSGGDLRPWAEAAFATAGIRLDGGAVRLMCFPRVLGHVFNPLSIWFGHGPDGALRGVIYEVSNTFGDRHAYVAAAGALGPTRQQTNKRFHVSPFFDVRGGYAFRLTPPGDAFQLTIRYVVEGAQVFSAAQATTRRTADDVGFLRVFFGQPLMTLKVVGGIHWQALRLWLKGARYRGRPAPPAPLSVGVLSLTESIGRDAASS